MSSKLIVKGYQLGQKIDHSGLRTVYRGIQVRTGQCVFITFIALRSTRALARLIKRSEQSRLLTHPSIVRAIDFGTIPDEGFYYTHAANRLEPLHPLLTRLEDPEERYFLLLRSFMSILDAVSYIHDAKTTHREIVTGNILIDPRENIFLDGFINAKAKTEARDIVNVVHLPYSAPEQLNGAPADRKTDIYALGTVFYELVTGQLPYDSNYAKLEEFRQGHIPSAQAVAQDTPHELEAIIRKALAPRSSRYSFVQDMSKDLEKLHEQRTLRRKLYDFSQSFKRMFSLRS